MAKFKSDTSKQTVLVPVCLDDQLIPGTLDFAIHHIVETEIDLAVFSRDFKNDSVGRPAYNPKNLLKAVLLAYSKGIIGSRRIETACRENIQFIAVTGWSKPDHATIARFISGMEEDVVKVFQKILLICEENHLLNGTEFALDGIKLSSNASKEWSGRFADLERKKAKLEKKLRILVKKHKTMDRRDKDGHDGRERQRSRLKKAAQKIGAWLDENEPRIGKRDTEIQSNITDNDSAKMKTSHGVIQGYNAQALVDRKHQIIVYAEAMGNGQDSSHVGPIIRGAKKTMKSLGFRNDYFKGKKLTADCSYHSSENLESCEKEELDAYIPDNQFRKRDVRFEDGKENHDPDWQQDTRQRFGPDRFKYDRKQDVYICPNGKNLSPSSGLCRFPKHISKHYLSKVNDCRECKKRAHCLESPGSRRKHLMRLVRDFRGNLSASMKAKIDTEKGRDIYSHRLSIVEPVFGNISSQKRLDRFTMRSKIKVNIQWVLYCLVHNIEKIARYGPNALAAVKG